LASILKAAAIGGVRKGHQESMTSDGDYGLLTSRDAGPVEITNRDGAGMFLLVGDHAGNRVPRRLNELGLEKGDLERHIALDIGIEALGRRLSRHLDAPFVLQRYSRLVIDCNRALTHSDSIAASSDGITIPGNVAVAEQDRKARAEAIYHPYHAAIVDLLAERRAAARQTIFVSLHSFTPVLAGHARPWQIGVLYGGGEVRFAQAVLSRLQGAAGIVVGDNEPYHFDETDFTVPYHAFVAGRAYVELEVRQNEIADRNGQDRMASLIADGLRGGADDFAPSPRR
jgi:predicted N-formylglutamate amidohydrolase